MSRPGAITTWLRPESPWLAWLLFGLTCALTALGLLFLALSWSAPVASSFGFRGHPAIWGLASAVAGQFLARRRPQNRIGWLFLAVGLLAAVNLFGEAYAAYAVPIRREALPGSSLGAWLASWTWFLDTPITLLVCLLFPTGRLVSPRWRPFAWAVAGAAALGASAFMLRPGPLTFNPYLDNPYTIAGSADVIQILISVAFLSVTLGFVAAGASVVVRLRRARGVERQQLKWFTYVVALLAIVGTIDSALAAIGGRTSNWVTLLDLFVVAALAAIPLTVLMAILRYHLYDIDRVINRTLVYALLTLALGLIYFGSVLLLRTLLRSLTGEQPEVVTVLSTLLIAALFVPVRWRIQSAIDRHFYRRKYNAARTLAAFSVTVRDEVDLERLSDQLVAAVKDTMEPAHVSLWLKPTDTKDILVFQGETKHYKLTG